MMNDDDIQQVFFVECDEALEATEAGLDACKAGTHDDETINAIFRGVHSIKGGAGAFGYQPLQAYTHCFENLLGDVREGKVPVESTLVDLLLLANDLLRDHVEAARSGDTPPDDVDLLKKLEAARPGSNSDSPKQEPDAASAASPKANDFDPLDDLDALLDELSEPAPARQNEPASDPTQPAKPDAHEWLVHIRPHSGAMANGGEPILWLRELQSMGGRCTRCHTSDVPSGDRLLIDEGFLAWTFAMPACVERSAVEEVFDFAGDDVSLSFDDAPIPDLKISLREEAVAEKKAAARPVGEDRRKSGSSGSSSSQSVRIDLKKLDKLIDGVGELVISQAMLNQRIENEGFGHIEELAMLDTLVRDIQEHAMAFRAQPISSVFGRVPRLLRELASNTGKHVKLEVSGETTELDKTVIERLSEPMTHLIRNAVDHGIESPADRTAAGKDAEGTLNLSAEQKAGRIVIQIADDGRGIDREKVLAKAVKNGLVGEDAELSADEINQLIFAPGFSTAASVSNISGRGVGMDVVKQNVKDLGGRITIDSTPGEGTTFTLALPLTLAISDGMIVQVGDQSLVIPLAHVIESLRPQGDAVKWLGTQRQMLNVRGSFVPIVSLGAMTGAHGWVNDACKGVLVLVETESFGRAALLVDAITDQRQFVIKSLDAHYRSVDSVAGATILGDGKVALIVDVDYLVQSASGSGLTAVAVSQNVAADENAASAKAELEEAAS
ncbi:MAG: chemotaxis protein CheA [Pseudomonadota bacterium]